MSKGTRNVAPQSIQQAHDVALAALLRGWRPLPITADGRKIPLVKFTSESGANLTATSSADVWSLWLEEFRGAGVAIVTGSRSFEGSGVLVVDVDVKDGAQGIASLEAAIAELGPLPATMVVRSPSGGFHYVYDYPDDSDTWRNWNGWRPGIDIRGHHGIVAVPGSTDARGTYTLEVDMEPTTLPPAWLEALIRPAADLAQRDEFAERDLAEADPELRRQRVIARDEIEILARQLETPGPGKHGRLVFAATAAGSWSHLIGDDEWLEEKLLRALERAHTVRGGYIDERKSRTGIRQLLHTGQVHPKWAPRVPVTLLGNIADYGLPVPIARPMPDFPARDWDDMGNADRLIDHRGEGIAYALDASSWLVYEERTGAWSTGGAETLAQRRAQETLTVCYEAEKEHYSDVPNVTVTAAGNPGKDKPSDRENFATFISRSRSAGGVSAMVKMASSKPALECRMADFDTGAMLLNVANGTLDLTTATLLPHSPEHRVTQLAPIRWQADDRSPLWEKFLEQVQPDPEVRSYLQRIVGYALTGSISEQKMFIHHGSGANGKSVFMDTLARVLGSYAQAVPSSTLLAKQGDPGVPNDIARMRGKRLLRTSETAAGRRLDGELVKQLTGGEIMSAREMRSAFFEFMPTGKVHLTTNHIPQLGTDDAIRRRLETIPWAVVIPREDRDPDLTLKLGLEASGILAWAVQGCLGWQAYGLATPAAVIAKTDEHLAMADPLGEWVESRLERLVGAECELKLLYGDYRSYAETHGERAMVARSLSEALTERGFRSHKDGKTRVRVFEDVTLRLTSFQQAAAGLGYGPLTAVTER